MSAVAQFEIEELLDLTGCRPRGNRHDCPKCGGLRTVTHTAECFYCHKCQWKGNVVTLQKELGIYQRIPSAEYRELCRNRNRAHEAALRLYSLAHEQELELWAKLHELGRAEIVAHDAGPDNPQSWDVLARVYAERPALLAELAILENGGAADLIRFLRADSTARESTIAGVIERGGLTERHGKFVEFAF